MADPYTLGTPPSSATYQPTRPPIVMPNWVSNFDPYRLLDQIEQNKFNRQKYKLDQLRIQQAQQQQALQQALQQTRQQTAQVLQGMDINQASIDDIFKAIAPLQIQSGNLDSLLKIKELQQKKAQELIKQQEKNKKEKLELIKTSVDIASKNPALAQQMLKEAGIPYAELILDTNDTQQALQQARQQAAQILQGIDINQASMDDIFKAVAPLQIQSGDLDSLLKIKELQQKKAQELIKQQEKKKKEELELIKTAVNIASKNPALAQQMLKEAGIPYAELILDTRANNNQQTQQQAFGTIEDKPITPLTLINPQTGQQAIARTRNELALYRQQGFLTIQEATKLNPMLGLDGTIQGTPIPAPTPAPTPASSQQGLTIPPPPAPAPEGKKWQYNIITGEFRLVPKGG